MPSISAVIIARNEEQNLRYCLQTVAWCDEIVVVDMESEDGTASIAREFTDNVYSHARIPDFDRAKKFAVEKAVGDWILLIDADELISQQLAATLKSITVKNNADVVEIPFKHYILGEWVQNTGWGYSPKPRFFRRHSIEFTGIIHDYMHIQNGAVALLLPPSEDNCISHFAYTDSSHFIDKLNRYTSVEAQQLFNEKKAYSSLKLITIAAREFIVRFLIRKGYKDGVRGFVLSLLMSFYRTLTYIKLWEHYEFKNEPVRSRYNKIKDEIVQKWEKDNAKG